MKWIELKELDFVFFRNSCMIIVISLRCLEYFPVDLVENLVEIYTDTWKHWFGAVSYTDLIIKIIIDLMQNLVEIYTGRWKHWFGAVSYTDFNIKLHKKIGHALNPTG